VNPSSIRLICVCACVCVVYVCASAACVEGAASWTLGFYWLKSSGVEVIQIQVILAVGRASGVRICCVFFTGLSGTTARATHSTS
jgi:hypothetical protein